MKNLLFTLVFSVLSVAPAKAELGFPPYENLSQEVQAAWGYKIDRSSSPEGYTFFDLTIPKKVAKLVMYAQLSIRDKQNQNLVSMDLSLFEGTDGNLHARIELFHDFGSAELVVHTKVLPDFPYYLGDFGGFTFTIPPQTKHP